MQEMTAKRLCYQGAGCGPMPDSRQIKKEGSVTIANGNESKAHPVQ